MKINLELEPVVGGHKITLAVPADPAPVPYLAEGFASTWKQVPARIKTMLADVPEPTS